MTRLLLGLCLLPLFAGLGSCRVSQHHVYSSDFVSTGVVLAERAETDVERTWRLFPGGDASPRVQIESRVSELVPRIGVRVSTLTESRARSAGAEPFTGVLITDILDGSPAADAGLRPRTVILAVADRPVTTVEQFEFVMSQEARIDESLELTIASPHANSAAAGGSTRLTISPRGEREVSTRTESIDLEQSKGLVQFAGLGAAMLPTPVAEDVFETPAGVPVVTGVVVGSPAYHAGLRCGDRILAIDGQPVDSLLPLQRAFVELLERDQPRAYAWDLRPAVGETVPAAPPGKRGVHLDVDSPNLGPYSTVLPFEPDYLERREFYVPILMNYEATPSHRESGFLNFIFTWGYNRELRYLPSASREPARRSRTTALPLGLVEVKRDPSSTRWTLLWFITWEVDHR